MAADEFTPMEQEVIDLLRSNDPTAADKLVALNDAERARVLSYVTTMSRVASPPEEQVDAVSGETPPTESESSVEEKAPPTESESAVEEKPQATWKARLGVLSRTRQPSKVALAVLGVAALVLFVVLVRACSGGGAGESRALLLVRESSNDLYVVDPGQEVDRANRAVRDLISLRGIRVTTEGVSGVTQFAALGDRNIVVARTQAGESAWLVDGEDYQQIIESESGTVSVVAVDETLYVKEESEGTQRCYRGSPDDLDRVSRGDYCEITRSGHVLIADQSEDSYRVRVVSPEDEELLRGNIPTRPDISANGLFLIVLDEQGVTVVSVQDGDRVWELEEAVGYNFASHPDGYLAIAAQVAGGDIVLAFVDSYGNAFELAEIAEGGLVAEFARSGNLFWLEYGDGENNLLSAWDNSQRDVVELANEEALGLVGVYGDSAVTATEDDFGVLFQRFLLDGSVRELHEFEDDSGLSAVLIEGDYLYAVGSELASVVPLSEGEATDSERWDRLTALDYHAGSLVLAGADGSSEVLFHISAGSADDLEYGQYDEIASAQIYGGTLYASVVDGSRVDTLAFDTSSGDELDEEGHSGYRLLNIRLQTVRNTLSAWTS